MKTLFLSIWHNWWNWDQWAVAQWTTEAIEAKKIVDGIISKWIAGVVLIKVPEKLNLIQRIAWINKECKKYQEPFAMEFHFDSNAKPEPKWASVWYNDDNQYTSSEWKQFLAEYTKVTGISSRHVNSDKKNRLWDLWFVSQVRCASLLIELWFLSNKWDLETVRLKWVWAVISGIIAMNNT